MPTIPTPTYQVALLGFSEFERNTLGSCFRLGSAGATGIAYVLTAQADEADFLLADADHPPSVRLVQAVDRATTTVFIGADPPDDALCWMSRPIDPLRVVRELDAMVAMSATPEGESAPGASAVSDHWQPETQPGWEPEWPPGLQPADAPGAAPPPLPVSPAPASPAPASRAPAAPAAALPVLRAEALVPDLPKPASPHKTRGPRVRMPAPRTALVVDDSDVAARFLLRRLAPWGLTVECASTSRQALALLDSRTYDLVFVDVELGPNSELDGLALCQHIKRSAANVDAMVIVVSAHQGELDRARGALAGCDAYLGKPLRDAELAPLLSRRGLVKPAAPADAG